jgi:hypothetical protein
MWMVAKIKKRELHIFKKELVKKLGLEIKFYNPKIQYNQYINNKVKKIEKFILENYIFCYHETFNQAKVISKVRFLKGLEYFLEGHHENQSEITKFISYCKSFEDRRGYLSPAFFESGINGRAQFVSGPFANMIFEIIEKQKNRLKILIGNFVTTIQDNKNYLYRSVL